MEIYSKKIGKLNYRTINYENCTPIQLRGDIYGRCTMLADNVTKRIFFDYAGEIRCELMACGKLKWNEDVPEHAKNIIRKNWSELKKQIYGNEVI